MLYYTRIRNSIYSLALLESSASLIKKSDEIYNSTVIHFIDIEDAGEMPKPLYPIDYSLASRQEWEF